MRTSTTILCILLLNAISGIAQDNPLTREFKMESIEKLSTLIVDNYVFAEVGQATADHIQNELKAGRFDSITSIRSFSKILTSSVQSVNHDKHMRVFPNGAGGRPNLPKPEGVGGFKESKILDGNIGYIDMRLFVDLASGSAAADEHMKKLADTDAIIIDLRKNGGGNPQMVQYLCSYFFDKKVHFNSLYFRPANTTREFWTVDVNGTKMPDVPLFVLTSAYTFSGAEEFSYNMQTQKRATLVGETTGGGANPGGIFVINDKLAAFIPTGKAINPITKTNWEGVGVVPEIKTTADNALEKAVELAKESGEKYRKTKKG